MTDSESKIATSLAAVADELFYKSTSKVAWKEAAQAGDAASILPEVDAELAANPQDGEVRLWWIYCQLLLASVPVTALSTPLEELRTHVKNQAKLQPQALSVFLHVSLRLVERKQLRLAVIMLESTKEIVEAAPQLLDPAIYNNLHSFQVNVLTREIDAALARREKKPYLSNLEQKLEALKASTPESAAELPTEPIAKPKRLSSKSIIEAHQKDSTTDADIPVQAGTQVVDDDAGSLDEEIVPTEPSGVRRAVFAGLALIAIVLLAGLGWRYVFSVSETEIALQDVKKAAESELEKRSAVKLPLPGTTNSVADPSNTRLNQVSKRLQKLTINGEGEGTDSESSSDDKAQNDPDVDTEALQEAADMIAEKEQAAAEKPIAKQPRLVRDRNEAVANPDRYKGAKVENLASGRVSERGIRRGSDGRMYGPPPGSNDRRTSLDGKTLPAYEVEQFDNIVEFRTIAPTDVFSAPSLLSKSLARLEAGAKLHVVAKMGGWLELRSTGGRRGYIYAQDAVKADR